MNWKKSGITRTTKRTGEFASVRGEENLSSRDGKQINKVSDENVRWRLS